MGDSENTKEMMMDAEARQEFAELCRSNNGVPDPEEVVRRAKDPKSSLHKYFTWDDAVAAKEHLCVRRTADDLLEEWLRTYTADDLLEEWRRTYDEVQRFAGHMSVAGMGDRMSERMSELMSELMSEFNRIHAEILAIKEDTA